MNPHTVIDEWKQNSWLDAGSMAYVEGCYEDYLRDPQSVPEFWRNEFRSWGSAPSHETVRHRFEAYARSSLANTRRVSSTAETGKQKAVWRMIRAYRTQGHLKAACDPLGLSAVQQAAWSLASFGLTESDEQALFDSDGLYSEPVSLKKIKETLERIYSGHLGVEYQHIRDENEKNWWQQQLEQPSEFLPFSPAEQKALLRSLLAAEGLEKYLGNQFVGQKRFSLEGGDALVPALEEILIRSIKTGVKEVVIGMAHRGRLNVLVNVLGRPSKDLFDEFRGVYQEEYGGTGDVKYHRGFSANLTLDSGEKAHISLLYNPSHLEIVNPVVAGSVRARQDRRGDRARQQVLPVVIHGDAALAGQGVNMELLNASQTRGFSTGGMIHIVVNNQVGFTTSRPDDARSSVYCTDAAKMIDAPVLHVNGDHPESVMYAARLAAAYRHRFGKDVFMDLVCYRKHGHNEADEPMITQPLMYQTIRKHPSVATQYAESLKSQGIVSSEEVEAMVADYRQRLEKEERVALWGKPGDGVDEYALQWKAHWHQDLRSVVDTRCSLEGLKTLATQLVQFPKEFQLQPQVLREYEARAKMAAGELSCNWGFAELLSYASLLSEGYDVRLSGEDCGRGTFSHRHALVYDQQTGKAHNVLSDCSPGKISVIDSLLSEEAVLAFEYGYASAHPRSLVIWEAQFGDFYNGAQMVVDQFIAAGEQKWGRLSHLIMLLPHGSEGQGPEHSSARIERFLQLCAQDNLCVCVPSTPSQIFHLFRRQLKSMARKPTITFSPKSFLRNKSAVSTLEELAEGHFHGVLDDPLSPADKSSVRRIIFCSGKVFYDLHEHRVQERLTDVVLIRVEQHYPFPEEEFQAVVNLYPQASTWVWCQEEPKNQGAWTFIQPYLLEQAAGKKTLRYAGRVALASTAEGSSVAYKNSQQRLITEAFQ